MALRAALVAVVLVGAACSGSTGTDDASPEGTFPVVTYPAVPFSTLDEQLATRVSSSGAAGSVLLVVQDQGVLHLTEDGEVRADTPMPVTDAGALLTSLVVLRLAEQGVLGLDDEVAAALPRWRAVLAGTTVRDLLGHTSTIPVDLACAPPTPDGLATAAEAVPGAACDAALDTAAPRLVDGERTFRIGRADRHVTVRLVEAVTGQPFDEVVRTRLTDPLGLGATRFVVPDDPVAAAATWLGTDAISTPAEWGRVLALVLARGRVQDGTELLRDTSIRELEADHTDRLDTHLEPWVAWTGVPTFGLGVWRDRLRGDGTAAQVSVVGRNGFTGWIDRQRNVWGVLAIDQPDNPGDAGAAIRASAALVQGPMQPAIDTEGRPLRRPGSVVIGSDGRPVPPETTDPESFERP